jgi:hypothetical protein
MWLELREKMGGGREIQGVLSLERLRERESGGCL